MIRLLVAGTTALALSACATDTKGRSEEVSFTSNPAGTTMTTDTGMTCKTPCTLKIERKTRFVATFEQGGKKRQIAVDSRMRGSGGAAVAGNILIGGVVGAGVDAATGAGLDHVPNPVHADFTVPQSEQITADKFVEMERAKERAEKSAEVEKKDASF